MSQLFIWQGFEHEWQREVLGFRLAHRLSSLVNYIEETDAGQVMVAGASPGVDGNFMEPRCFYRKVDAPNVCSTRHMLELEGTDCLDESGTAPEASIELSGEVVHDIASRRCCDAILAGIDLSWNCDPSKQPEGWPGNSNGVWPAEIDVCIEPPQRSGHTTSWRVRVRVVRGWTPMRGGVPLVAEKRLNHTMDLRARIHLQILEGTSLRIERQETLSVDGDVRNQKRLVADAMSSGDTRSIAAMTQFGFAIPHHAGRGPKRHRGRYLSAIGFGISDEGEHHQVWGRVSVPVTVVPARVRHSVTPAVIHFDGESTLEAQRCVSGEVHSNSSDEAPFFSTYNRFEADCTLARVPLD